MALTGILKKENNAYKIDFETVYYKIDKVMINLLESSIHVNIRGYASEYARHNDGIGIFKKSYKIPISVISEVICTKDLILEALYNYIKNIDDYTELEDAISEYEGSVTKKIENPRNSNIEPRVIDLMNDV